MLDRLSIQVGTYPRLQRLLCWVKVDADDDRGSYKPMVTREHTPTIAISRHDILCYLMQL